jgi:hypothetical protein
VVALVLGITSLTLAGCSKPPKEEESAVKNLRKIVQAFSVAEYKVHRAPRDEAELKRFLGETGVTGDLDQVLISPRDNQPYAIGYGARLEPEGMKTILAHEKDGVEGARWVLMLSGDVKLLPDEEFARAEFARGLKDPKKK